MYTTLQEYKDFFDLEVSYEFSDYQRIEDIAILWLEEYCWAFPNLEEWGTLEEPTKTYIFNAIMYQINHIDRNREIVLGTNPKALTSFSIGRFSVNEKESSEDGDSVDRLDDIATDYMDRSGICKNSIKTCCCGYECLCQH